MRLKEHIIQDEIRLAVSKETPLICLRCNAGQVWAGEKKYTPEYGYVITNPRPVKLLPEGFPDLLCLGPDADVVFLEVKNEKGKTRPAQDRFLSLMDGYGFSTAVVRSADEAVAYINSQNRRYHNERSKH